MQLVLAAVFHIDAPAGNIPLDEAKKLAAHRAGEAGDSAGARRQLQGLSHRRHDARLSGALRREARRRQAVGPADAGGARRRSRARAPGSAVGAKFAGAHGMGGDGGEAQGHDDTPFEVVGVLAPTGTVLDRLVLTASNRSGTCTSTHGEKDVRPGDHGAAHPLCHAARRGDAAAAGEREPAPAGRLARLRERAPVPHGRRGRRGAARLRRRC